MRACSPLTSLDDAQDDPLINTVTEFIAKLRLSFIPFILPLDIT